MKYNLYSVEDVKAARFNPPFTADTHVDAIRAFAKPCQNPESLWNQYPTDYRLMFIGTFDNITGEVKSQNGTFISSALDHQPKPTAQNVAVPMENGLNEAGKHFTK